MRFRNVLSFRKPILWFYDVDCWGESQELKSKSGHESNQELDEISSNNIPFLAGAKIKVEFKNLQ